MSDEKIPAGFYKGRALANSEQYGTSKEGTEQIALDLEIPSLNRCLTTFLFFTDNATEFAIQRLRACGWTGDDVTKLVGIDTNEIDVSVKYETYQGKERMKVEIATNGGGRVKLQATMDEKAKRSFGARVAMMIKAGPQPKAAKPANAGKPMPSDERFGGADDEIPF